MRSATAVSLKFDPSSSGKIHAPLVSTKICRPSARLSSSKASAWSRPACYPLPFHSCPNSGCARFTTRRAPRPRRPRTRQMPSPARPAPSPGLASLDAVVAAIPSARVSFTVDDRRQAIVDSWPEDVDDSAARRDWGFSPEYGFGRAFSSYLIPGIS